ncbi:hypothetical protein ACFT0G_35770 [Streptomyces sp. NPDC057020]|uniref:hypothetical protein n=1 Tax=unclassified Streptomyces TaxID=2593676 RepID=UPI003630D75C
MTEGGEVVTSGEPVSLVKAPQKSKHRIPVWAVAGGAVLAAAAVSLWVWAPWVDRSPFTAYIAGVGPGESAVEGSTPGSCVRTAASEEETVIYDEDGKRLASGRAEREGERLGPEFGDFAGDCLIMTRIDNVPGGLGTYWSEWGGGDRHEVEEEDLRLTFEEHREFFKTVEKTK